MTDDIGENRLAREMDDMGRSLLSALASITMTSGETAAAGLVAVDVLVDLLDERGVISRADFIARLNRRRDDLRQRGKTQTDGSLGAMFDA